MCLRCGTLRVTDTWASDPESWVDGLQAVEYAPGRYAGSVKERFCRYRADAY